MKFTAFVCPVGRLNIRQQLTESCYVIFFYLGFLSRIFTIQRTAWEWGGYLFNSSLPLLPASQTLRHQPDNYCRQLITLCIIRLSLKFLSKTLPKCFMVKMQQARKRPVKAELITCAERFLKVLVSHKKCVYKLVFLYNNQ